MNEDPQPFIEAGYYTEHHKVIVGAIHAGYKNEAILGYAYDFNERWRAQVGLAEWFRKFIDDRLHLQRHARFSIQSCALRQQ